MPNSTSHAADAHGLARHRRGREKALRWATVALLLLWAAVAASRA